MYSFIFSFSLNGFSHNTQFEKLVETTTNEDNPLIPFDEIINTTKASFAAIESLKQGKWVVV